MNDLLTKEQRERWVRNINAIRREMAMSDWTSGVNHAIRERNIEIAKNAIKKGFTLEDISDLTELPIDILKELQKQL